MSPSREGGCAMTGRLSAKTEGLSALCVCVCACIVDFTAAGRGESTEGMAGRQR